MSRCRFCGQRVTLTGGIWNISEAVWKNGQLHYRGWCPENPAYPNEHNV